jgi:hypothetical protein
MDKLALRRLEKSKICFGFSTGKTNYLNWTSFSQILMKTNYNKKYAVHLISEYV